MFCVQELRDQLLKNRLNVKQNFEQRIKVHQRKDLLKKEQCIKKVLGLDRIVLQDKFTTPVMLNLQHKHV